MTGLHFVQALCGLSGVAALLTAVGLLMAGTSKPYTRQGSAAENARRLAWQETAERPWAVLSRWAGGRFVAGLEAIASRGFSRVQTSPAWSPTFLGLVWGFIPAASFINLLIGGSPFLFGFCLAVAAAVLLLIVLGESRLLGPVKGLLALFAGVSVLVLLPGYAAFAFTKVTLAGGFTHRVLQAPLIAVFWYLACWGTGVVVDWLLSRPGASPAPGPGARFIHQVLAVAPFAFVLFFVALLFGHLSVFEDEPVRNWRLLAATVAAFAVNVPVCLLVLKRVTCLPSFAGLASVAATTAVAWAFGAAIHVFGYGGDVADAGRALFGLTGDAALRGGLHLGPEFWVVHLPFLVPLALAAWLVTQGLKAAVARLTMRAVAGGERRIAPTTAEAAVAGLWGVLLLAAAWAVNAA